MEYQDLPPSLEKLTTGMDQREAYLGIHTVPILKGALPFRGYCPLLWGKAGLDVRVSTPIKKKSLGMSIAGKQQCRDKDSEDKEGGREQICLLSSSRLWDPKGFPVLGVYHLDFLYCIVGYFNIKCELHATAKTNELTK